MAIREGTRASSEFICVSILPDVCKSPSVPVPYKILSLFDSAVNYSTNVKFRKQFAFHHDSRLTTVRCDELGVGGGMLSGVNMGWCRPIPGTHSSTVRVNGSFVDYHEGTYMFMNCAGPEGPFNTIGQVLFLGNMLPGPVGPSGKITASSFCSTPDLMSDLQDLMGKADKLIKLGKKLYELANTDWSDPSSVLGAIGGLAGLAGLQGVAGAAGQIKDLYDLGKKVADTDWSDPKSVLGTVAGVANVAGMEDIAKTAELAKKVANVIDTDWSDPKAATAAAIEILKSTGMDEMLIAMANNAISSNKVPVPISGNAQPLFPQPGSSTSGPTATPSSANGKPKQKLTPELISYLKDSNPAAYARYEMLSPEQKKNAFAETTPGDTDSKNDRTAFYIPGDGFTTTQAERDGLFNVSQYIPDSIKEIFVADKTDATEGNFFGIKEKEGNVYLFGGLIDLGSPGLPGAGAAKTWWIPDRILNMDMSKYYDHHDKNYYGSEVGLSELGKILQHEIDSFKAGATTNPLQLPLQAIYSAATTAVGALTAAKNSILGVGQGTFDSLGDFYDNVFGESKSGPASIASGFVAGGCTGPISMPSGSGGTGAAGGGGPTGTGTGTPPSVPAAGGAASGAGADGMLVTTAPGNPAAAAAAIEAQFRKDNAKAKTDAEDAAAKAKAEAEAKAKEKAEEEAKKRAEDEQQHAEEEDRKKTEEDDKQQADSKKEDDDYDENEWHPDDRISWEQIKGRLGGLADFLGSNLGPGKAAGKVGQALEGAKDVLGTANDLGPVLEGRTRQQLYNKLKRKNELEKEIAMYRKAIVQLSKVEPKWPDLVEKIEMLSEINDSKKAELESIGRDLIMEPLRSEYQRMKWEQENMA